jgi:hypothetical protein
MYQSAQTALEVLRDRLGTWREVAEYLANYQEGRLYAALLWNVARRGSKNGLVEAALIKAGLIERPPVVVEVEACDSCGGLHDFHATCPSRKRPDTRKTRAWHGTGEEAAELDRRLSDLGFRNLQHWVDEALLKGEWFDFSD